MPAPSFIPKNTQYHNFSETQNGSSRKLFVTVRSQFGQKIVITPPSTSTPPLLIHKTFR